MNHHLESSLADGSDPDHHSRAPLSEKQLEDLKRVVDDNFEKATELNNDVMNSWPMLDPDDPLEPVMHYEQHFRDKYPQLADYIIGRSSPQQMKAYNQLVDQYNNDLERIKREGDTKSIEDYIKKAQRLVYGREIN